MPIAYVHNQSMFLKTSGLNHKWFMLHCLVFKEQLCLSKLSLQATHLLYRISFRLSRSFLFFFFVWVICSSKALPIKEYFLARPISRGDLYYITGRASICQPLSWTFSKKVAWDLGFTEMRHDTKKASLPRCSSPYGRGSWTRTNACGIQRPVPYQLGDTPVSSASRCQQKLL